MVYMFSRIKFSCLRWQVICAGSEVEANLPWDSVFPPPRVGFCRRANDAFSRASFRTDSGFPGRPTGGLWSAPGAVLVFYHRGVLLFCFSLTGSFSAGLFLPLGLVRSVPAALRFAHCVDVQIRSACTSNTPRSQLMK